MPRFQNIHVSRRAQRRARARAHHEALEEFRRLNHTKQSYVNGLQARGLTEPVTCHQRFRNPIKHRIRATVYDSNQRYPLASIREAKLTGQNPKPHTRAAHWPKIAGWKFFG